MEDALARKMSTLFLAVATVLILVLMEDTLAPQQTN